MHLGERRLFSGMYNCRSNQYAAMYSEVWRVLSPGAASVLYPTPRRRKRYDIVERNLIFVFQQHLLRDILGLQWHVEKEAT